MTGILPRQLALLLTAVLVASCQSTGFLHDPVAPARTLATDAGFSEQRIAAGEFELFGFRRGFSAGSRNLTVYIEGDGRAFVSRRRVSNDPTPRDPVALQMAVADPAATVAYLARPCQFVQPLPDSCESRYWTTARYAPAVVAAMNTAVDQLRADSGAASLTLVGFSGGGTIATLLAARRDDVDWLVTVAGNLDHAAWTRHHGDTPLDDSLNPADVRDRLADVRQLHLAGGDDDTLPPALVAGFVRGLPPATPVELLVFDDADHDDWPAIWARHVCTLAFRADTAGCVAAAGG
ncbi:pimeloyl-ACP methyl ester carboxylesterase [Methylohalomonas lacus]|uniref:Pimeloyl-ACP methyl ester carboxylesterase n=1 Tax=Methylohalomonas lacus TaxID=398773 RepID=A0AAE3HLM8_9GAMM|nr:alpha/beta hydrolase [Methylohalomonas lacus]MCS3904025.1 pimeloyl-ACP methyl ester carboxylesterase [Methylohalomonas lacus]